MAKAAEMTIETIEIETSLAEFIMLPGESKGLPPPL
jgi:hypothetical protein